MPPALSDESRLPAEHEAAGRSIPPVPFRPTSTAVYVGGQSPSSASEVPGHPVRRVVGTTGRSGVDGAFREGADRTIVVDGAVGRMGGDEGVRGDAALDPFDEPGEPGPGVAPGPPRQWFMPGAMKRRARSRRPRPRRRSCRSAASTPDSPRSPPWRLVHRRTTDAEQRTLPADAQRAGAVSKRSTNGFALDVANCRGHRLTRLPQYPARRGHVHSHVAFSAAAVAGTRIQIDT